MNLKRTILSTSIILLSTTSVANEQYKIIFGNTGLKDMIPEGQTVYKSCNAILENGKSNGDGTYTIDPTGDNEFDVFCDMTTDGGGWTKLTRDLVQNQFSTEFNERVGYGRWENGYLKTGDIDSGDGSDVIIDINIPFNYQSFFMTDYSWKDVDDGSSHTWDLNSSLTSLNYTTNADVNNSNSDITIGASQANSPTLSFHRIVGSEADSSGKIVELNNNLTIYNNPVESSVLTFRANEGGYQNEDAYIWYQGAIWIR